MRDAVTKHSMLIRGHKTSVSLEDGFWQALVGIARMQGRRINDLVSEIIDQDRAKSVSSGIRLYVLAHYQEATA